MAATTYRTEDIRNIALVGHSFTGKTSLAEALLLAGGAVHQAGSVEKGTTVSDHTDEEKRRKMSVHSSVMHLDHGGVHVNLLDAPGFADFVGEACAALQAVETAVVVVSAAMGIEPGTRRMMDRAARAGLCRIVAVNKIDHPGVDLADLLAQLRATFGPGRLPLNLPAGGGTRVVDCFLNAEGDSDLGPVSKYHTMILDQVVEEDEALMASYLAGGDGAVNADVLHAPFEKALREGHLVPVVFVSARTVDNPAQSVGVKEFLDIVEHLAPNPLEGNPRRFHRGGGEAAIAAEADPGKPVIAHNFKVVIDRFGKMGVFRVHQGTLARDAQLYIGEARKPVRLGHLHKVQGKDHSEVERGIPGDICAALKVEGLHQGSVLHSDPDDHLRLECEPMPEPMYGLAVTPRKRGDEQKLADTLAKLLEEEPILRVVRDASTHQVVIHGTGELHLRLVLERMREKYHLEVDTQPPKVPYRETVLAKAEGHHRHKKQTGGAGQFGEVYLRVMPLERGAGFEYADETFGGSIPRQYIPAIEKGVRQAMERGCVAGYRMQDIRVEVYDGKYHDVDSKEIAFVTAGRKAFIDAVLKARPAVLEPIVKVEVTVPERFMGDINGDLSGKRGRIQGAETQPGEQVVVRALAPLAEVANYQNQLKSVTGGQGSFTMELSHYEPLPPNLQAQVIAAYKPHAEEE